MRIFGKLEHLKNQGVIFGQKIISHSLFNIADFPDPTAPFNQHTGYTDPFKDLANDLLTSAFQTSGDALNTVLHGIRNWV